MWLQGCEPKSKNGFASDVALEIKYRFVRDSRPKNLFFEIIRNTIHSFMSAI
jgi:hypothetical protein